MKTYLTQLMADFSYPEEAASVLLDAYRRICEHAEISARFHAFLEEYEKDYRADIMQMYRYVLSCAEVLSVHRYTLALLLFLCLSKGLKNHYRQQHLQEDMWLEGMRDLKYKLIECHLVKGVWGSFVANWFVRFFTLAYFSFGKLQFELVKFPRSYSKDGLTLTPDSDVINVHIPRTGTPLDRASQLAAYRAAAAFFMERYGLSRPVFMCESWLLFPRNLEVLSPESNLRQFISDYEIVTWGEYADYAEVWRLFDADNDGDPEHLPQNTSLRRAYASWIRNGEKTGWGIGVRTNAVL